MNELSRGWVFLPVGVWKGLCLPTWKALLSLTANMHTLVFSYPYDLSGLSQTKPQQQKHLAFLTQPSHKPNPSSSSREPEAHSSKVLTPAPPQEESRNETGKARRRCCHLAQAAFVRCVEAHQLLMLWWHCEGILTAPPDSSCVPSKCSTHPLNGLYP